MSEVPIQISGVLYDKTARSKQSVVLMGKASIMGLTIGGGPIIPPEEVPPVDPGYGVPEPPPHPEHPIYFPPEGSTEPPPGIWGPNDPRPTPPIELPPNLPPVDGENRPIDWKVGWTEETGWIVVGVPQFPHPTPSK